MGAAAIRAVACKPDGNDGVYTMYWHEDSTADLWQEPAGRPAYCLIGRQVLYRVRAEMAVRGISEGGWTAA